MGAMGLPGKLTLLLEDRSTLNQHMLQRKREMDSMRAQMDEFLLIAPVSTRRTLRR